MKKFIVFILLFLVFPIVLQAGTYDEAYIAQYGNSLSTALSKIGYSTRRTLNIHTPINLSADANMPDNITINIGANGSIALGNYNLILHGDFICPPARQAFWITGLGKAYFRRSIIQEVSVNWWGAIGDGVTDSTNAFNWAATCFQSGFEGKVIIPQGNYLLSSTIIVPTYVSFMGSSRGSVIKPSALGEFCNNYVFYINTNDGTTWVMAHPVIGSRFADFCIDNSSGLVTTKGILCAGSASFEGMYFKGLVTAIDTTGNIIDSLRIRSIYLSEPRASDYQINVTLSGSGAEISNVTVNDPNQTQVYTLALTGCSGGSINACTGGTYKFFKCDALTVSGIHSETGNIVVDNSNLSIKNCYLQKGSWIPLVIERSGSDIRDFEVNLQDITIGYVINTTPAVFGSSYEEYDLQTHTEAKINLSNVCKRIVKTTDIGINGLVGIKVKKQDGTDFKKFNDNSYLLSKTGEILENEIINFNNAITIGSGSYIGVGSIATSPSVEWDANSGNYYYTTQLIWDTVKKIGITSALPDPNLSLTQGGDGVLIPYLFSSWTRNATIRLYRGSSAGSYNKYVNVPVIANRRLFDTGSNVNGLKWVSRTTGPVDPNFQVGTDLQKTGDKCAFWGYTIPIGGTWTKGNYVWLTNPAPATAMGVVCTTSGTFSASTDATGDTDGSTAVITGMADTSDFFIDEYVSVSAGFTSTGPYRIISKTDSSITLSTNSSSAQSNITVSTPDPVFKAMPNLGS